MTLLPAFCDLANEFGYFHSHFCDDFGFPFHPFHHHWWGRPVCYRKCIQEAIKRDGIPIVGKDGLQISIDVKLYEPNEITVKTKDNLIIVEGKQEDKQEGDEKISRQFCRKYRLPRGYDAKDVESTLSADGYLTVKVPPPPPKQDDSEERIVTIKNVGASSSTLAIDDGKKSSKKY